MHKRLLMLAGLVVAAPAMAANVSVDFGRTCGAVKPLHGVGQGPALQGPACGTNFSLFCWLKEAGVPFSRLHDVGGAYGGNRYVDIPNVFRDFDADENDPANYDFAFTDLYLKALVEYGVEPYYRLGVTIECDHKVRAYRIHPPKDFAKWARICEHVIRHYTEGWAEGYRWKIRYWEIWNEPENAIGEDNNMWTGTFADYCRLYDVASKHLKAKFPHLKIGGYAGCGFYDLGTEQWRGGDAKMCARFAYLNRSFEEFLSYVKEHQCPFDFFSYHFYDAPSCAELHFRHARRRLDEMGFTKTETSVNEWLPNGPVGSPKQAAGVAAVLCALQNCGVDSAMIYDAKVGPGPYSPLFDPGTLKGILMETKVRKAYWALKDFNELYRLGRIAACMASGEGVYACAATDGRKGAVLVANTTTTPQPLELAAGVARATGCRLTDATHDDAAVPVPQTLPPESFALLTFEL